MKRLLCILSSLDAGGAETFIMKIFRKLPKDYKIDFIVSADNGFYENEVVIGSNKVIDRKSILDEIQKIEDEIRNNLEFIPGVQNKYSFYRYCQFLHIKYSVLTQYNQNYHNIHYSHLHSIFVHQED